MNHTSAELRVIDTELLDMVRTIATRHDLDSTDMLLRLVSVTALWTLTAQTSLAPPEAVLEMLLSLQTETFNHYARQQSTTTH